MVLKITLLLLILQLIVQISVPPPFFSNLLPEGRLRTYLANKAGVSEVREFFLLWVDFLDCSVEVSRLGSRSTILTI